MAEKKKTTEDTPPGVAAADMEPIVDGSPTSETPEHPDEGSLKKDDASVGPNVVGDAQPNDPPVRTNRPDVPVIQRLASGAGEHTPNRDPEFAPDGRFTPPEGEVVKTAKVDSGK